MALRISDGDAGMHTVAIDQRRNDADLLLHVLARAATARRAVRIQRLDFLADESRPLGRRCARRDAQTNLVRMFVGKKRASVERRAADQVDAQLIELAVQSLANDVGGKASS